MLWNIILLASIAFQTTEALSTPTSMTSSTRRLLPTTTTPPPTTTIRNRQLTTNLLTTTTVSTTFSDITTSPLPLRLKLQAAPDYPVTEGQVVVLQCLVHSGSVVGLISWQWVRYSDNF
ncbi:hepatitis A virus cellular receptor 1-like [Periophthalmus magnuspinnatus]|uniref:hepatitis A virus cellular receptor 1-like n=1 Tax=Periophthalmus magnuspinnatus TaxID=409849 RepID=UPI0024363E5B|nr:hepatitis A virus cellular receptor 1-like [Periophthalmus magnuspinnatus]